MIITGKVSRGSARQLERNLRSFKSKIDRSAKRSALQKAARPMLRAAKDKVPKRHGHLKKSLIIKVRTNKRSKDVIAYVGPKSSYKATSPSGRTIRPSHYAHLVEFGTSHSPAQPFMRPAFDSAANDALQVYARELKKDIPRLAKRMDKKYRKGFL